MVTQTKGALLSCDVSATIRPVAEKWTDALNATVSFLHTANLSEDDRTEVLTLVMQTAAAVLAPFEPTVVERKNMSQFFLTNLTMICEQYFDDKREFGASR